MGESTIAMLTKYKMFYIKVSIITIRYSVVLQDKIQCIAPCFKLDKGSRRLNFTELTFVLITLEIALTYRESFK